MPNKKLSTGPDLLQAYFDRTETTPLALVQRSGGRLDNGGLSRYLKRQTVPSIGKAKVIFELTGVPIPSWTADEMPRRKSGRSKRAA